MPAVKSLSHFLLRQESIKLWRGLVREAYRLPAGGARPEVLSQIHREFRRDAALETDEHRTKFLIIDGQKKLEELRSLVAAVR